MSGWAHGVRATGSQASRGAARERGRSVISQGGSDVFGVGVPLTQ